MKNFVLFGVFVFLLVAIQFAGGKTIDEIIEKYIRTKGGAEKLVSVECMYLEGLITLLGISAGLKISTIRNELNPAGFNIQWVITDHGLTDETLKSPLNDNEWIKEVMTELEDVPGISDHLTGYHTRGSSVVLIGREVIEDNNCYHLKLTTKDQTEIHYWMNISNLLLQQSCIMAKSTAAVNAGYNYITYSNYKVVSEILIAHSLHIEKRNSRVKESCQVVFDKILINQPGRSII
jgi:hypothetical protein